MMYNLPHKSYNNTCIMRNFVILYFKADLGTNAWLKIKTGVWIWVTIENSFF
jgi:hypothetical protein